MGKTRVVHIMSDGTVLDSVAGLKIPVTNRIAYAILAKYAKKKEREAEEETA